MKTADEVLKKMGNTQESYITTWIDTNDEIRESCLLAHNENEAMWSTKYIYNDCVKTLSAKRGTLPFSF